MLSRFTKTTVYVVFLDVSCRLQYLTRSSAIADGPRDELSAEILSTVPQLYAGKIHAIFPFL